MTVDQAIQIIASFMADRAYRAVCLSRRDLSLDVRDALQESGCDRDSIENLLRERLEQR